MSPCPHVVRNLKSQHATWRRKRTRWQFGVSHAGHEIKVVAVDTAHEAQFLALSSSAKQVRVLVVHGDNYSPAKCQYELTNANGHPEQSTATTQILQSHFPKRIRMSTHGRRDQHRVCLLEIRIHALASRQRVSDSKDRRKVLAARTLRIEVKRSRVVARLRKPAAKVEGAYWIAKGGGAFVVVRSVYIIFLAADSLAEHPCSENLAFNVPIVCELFVQVEGQVDSAIFECFERGTHPFSSSRFHSLTVLGKCLEAWRGD